MKERLNDSAGVVALLALIIAVLGTSLVGANAAGVFVTSRQIKNGTILSQDVHKNALNSGDIKNSSIDGVDIGTGQVEGSDIGTGQVGTTDIATEGVTAPDVANNSLTGEDLELPDPSEVQDPGVAKATVNGETYSLIDVAGKYSMVEAAALEVTWTGSAAEGEDNVIHSPCVFELRVDGQPSSGGGGEVFVRGKASVSMSVLFPGLAAGEHQIEVWARHAGGSDTSCIVGPNELGIDQSFIVAEQVG